MSFRDEARVRDSLAAAMDRARESANNVGIVGFGVIELRNPLGHLTYVDNFTNIVTTAGDLYYAAKAVTNIGTPNAAAPTAANGMKLGSGGGTTPTKSSTQAALVTYISGSNLQFDAAFPDVVDETGDTGASARYKCTWGAGVVTNSDIDEVVIVNDRATDATSTAANTYSRAIFTSINKTSSDSLAITWKHLFLGA